MKKNYDLPLLLHTSREASETEEKQWFSQYSKTGQCKAPQESTQLCADWHKASQTNGNVWVREVQGRDHPSTGRNCISSSIFQLSMPPPCVLKRLSAYGANYKHFKEKQNSKMKGHFPPGTSLLQEAPPSIPLFLPMVWKAQMPLGQNTIPINFSAGQGWDGEVGSSTYNLFID